MCLYVRRELLHHLSWYKKKKGKIVNVCLKFRKNISSQQKPLHLPFCFLPSPSITSLLEAHTHTNHNPTSKPLTQPDFDSHLSHIKTLPWESWSCTLLASSFSLSLSFSGNDFHLWLHAYLGDVFLFFLALSITLLTLLHRESIHLFGWGVVILRVIYTFYSVQMCEIVEGGGLHLE